MALLQQHLAETATFIRSQHPGPIDCAVVLGSGLGMFVDALVAPTVIDYARIPHFMQSTVEGHAGRLAIGEIADGYTIACMQGRFHYYEGHAMERVVYPIRALRQLGAQTLVVTNAAGGINASFNPGTLMLIEDHLNLMGDNPLNGPNHDFLGPRFPDMSEAYSAELRQLARRVAEDRGIPLAQGVYAAMGGPSYETPAEVRMLRTLGADAVGMSTVPEVIVANHMGMRVLGMSCITNLAAGISPHRLSHEEVMATSEQVRDQFVTLLKAILTEIALQSKKQPAGSTPGDR